MGLKLTELLQKQLQMTPEQIAEFRESARLQAEKFEKGKKSVGKSPDFLRIKNIPSRPWDYFQHEEFVHAATDALRTPDGTMVLRPVQAALLIEAQRAVEMGANGVVGLMGVGSGKALCSMLLGTVLNSQRCVLLVPPALVEQTTRVYNQMRKHWQVMPSMQFHIVSYSTLSSTKNFDILERIKPDLIIADEASALKNKSASRTKRVTTHVRVFKPRFCVLSGTLTTRSLKDFQHLLLLVLGIYSPVPEHWPTLNEWCEALDANVSDFKRREPGVILDFRQKADETPREAYRNRLINTLGIVSTATDRLGTSLLMNKRALTLSPKVEEMMKKVQKTWERPDGEAFADVLELSALERELSCGFWNKWIWPKDAEGRPIIDEEWLEARKNWNHAVRERLHHSSPGMDSPKLLFNAAERDFLDRTQAVETRLSKKDSRRDGLPRWSCKEFEPWYRVYKRDVPPTVAQWVDDEFMVNDAVAWGNETGDDKGPGIIWFSHVALGKKIAERGGFPYYGSADETKSDRDILDEKGDRTIVVSMNAHSEGKNLQHAFWRNLITTPFASGKIGEQVIGRTHRPFQPRDEVIVDFYLHTPCFERSFASAVRDAHYAEDLLGPQKLVYGTKSFEGYD